MTVNMNEIKKGSVLHLRCGGKIEVERSPIISGGYICLEGNTTLSWSAKDGSWLLGVTEHPLDIIKIDPPQLDWDDVEWGMGFLVDEGFVCHYIGVDPVSERPVLRMPDNHRYVYDGFPKSRLTRAPEHDIKVKK